MKLYNIIVNLFLTTVTVYCCCQYLENRTNSGSVIYANICCLIM